MLNPLGSGLTHALVVTEASLTSFIMIDSTRPRKEIQGDLGTQSKEASSKVKLSATLPSLSQVTVPSMTLVSRILHSPKGDLLGSTMQGERRYSCLGGGKFGRAHTPQTLARDIMLLPGRPQRRYFANRK